MHIYKRSIVKIKKEYKESSLPRTIWCIYLPKKHIILRQQSGDDSTDECLNYRITSTQTKNFYNKKHGHEYAGCYCMYYIQWYKWCKNISKIKNTQ